MMRTLQITAGILTGLLVCACSPVESSQTTPKKYDITASCSGLAGKASTLDGVSIASARPVAATEALPAFCQITGIIEPHIGFEARYPLTEWNDKYFQAGCGGFCGVVSPNRETQSNAINHALRRGYAAITTDAGHEGLHIGDARWAKNNPEAEEVYAHKTLPLTLDAGHNLIAALYDETPNYSYFSGCSNGGRMGAIAAQRYPDLFDGIISGCPVLNLSLNGGAFGAWVLQAMTGADGKPILNYAFASKLAMLEANSLAQCDEQDGNKDGIISKPFDCHIDLDAVPVCGETPDNVCLTKPEMTAVNLWYKGPVTRTGKSVFPGMPPGSERYWGHWYLGNEKFPGPGTLLADGYGRYLGFPNDPDNYSALDFNFDTDVQALAEQGELYNALDPDLTAFKQSGGKMIMWHGLSDPLVLPNQSPGYYDNVEAVMGGQEAVQSFYRLFMAPGLGHCWDKPANAPDRMDMLTALEDWVELGQAPESIQVTQYHPDDNRIVREGVLRPYPLEVEYGPILP